MIHTKCKKIKAKGKFVQKIVWKQTDGQTDRQTDSQDRLNYLSR